MSGRRWSPDGKARIVKETQTPGAKVSEVARRNNVAASVLFTWGRKARIPSAAAAPFIPISLFEEPTAASVVVPAPPVRSKRGMRGVIEIDLGNGQRVKVDADVDADALSRVLDVLDRR